MPERKEVMPGRPSLAERSSLLSETLANRSGDLCMGGFLGGSYCGLVSAILGANMYMVGGAAVVGAYAGAWLFLRM